MAFIALACGIATPIFTKTLEAAKLKSDAQQMASVLRMARQEAITSGQPRTVVFYPQNAKYKISGQSYYYLQSGITFFGTTNFTKQVGGLPACGFSPSGASSGGTITLRNSNNRLYVIVYSAAGRVRVSESPPEY